MSRLANITISSIKAWEVEEHNILRWQELEYFRNSLCFNHPPSRPHNLRKPICLRNILVSKTVFFDPIGPDSYEPHHIRQLSPPPSNICIYMTKNWDRERKKLKLYSSIWRQNGKGPNRVWVHILSKNK